MALHISFLPHLLYSSSKQSLPQRALHSSLYLHCSSVKQDSQRTAQRRSANYQPTTWTSDFVKSLTNYNSDEIHKQRAKKLKEEVRAMIGDEDVNPSTTLELIDDIQRLGLSYHFEEDNRRALNRIMFVQGTNVRLEKGVHATALYFRLCRQHGFEVSQDVFQKFKDHDGNFKQWLCEDVKGLLSLYEASHLAFDGENILDEAKVFTTKHLKGIKGNIDTTLMQQIKHALEPPFHHRMLRLEARWYIQAYSERRDANHLLLELAKLDFNMVQSKLQRELQQMSRWWEDIGLANKLSFARDRLMECFFWTVGMVFEPQFSSCRKGLTKVTTLITTIDDVYDVYGSLDELELFTAAVERWDTNVVETLPDYMKLCFLALYNIVNEMAYDALKQHGVNIIPYLTRAWADLCKAFLVEAKWCFNKETPTFEAYLENAWRSVSGVVILVHAYFLMTKTITKEALDSLQAYHSLLECSSIIFRLTNDLGTSKDELERGESANSILCYMKENGVSEQVARKHISSLIDETWKKMNKDRVIDSPFEKSFVETAINLARISQCTYQHGDGHGSPDSQAKNRVLSVIIEPITLM
uniref:Terpene synthase 2 n=1 Tax=Camellia sinensis TaxID=4442 RepID=A0A167V6J7_CAMSI|nr:terpene synthase 2 [Camellia sinensis]